jgi:protein TonB
MSDRQHFPNALGYSQHSSPTARYGTGIALMLVVHAGAILAIKNGLDIRGWISDIPPPIATKVIVPPAIPQKPVEQVDPRMTEFTIDKPNTPPKIDIEEEKILPPPSRDLPPPGGGGGVQTGNGDPIVLAARSDPRHPLTQPAYPLTSRKLGEQGSVQLLVFVLPNGRVSEAQVANSSGFERLDEAAVREALRAWRFLSNTVDGVAVGGWCRIGITFRLKD